MAESLSLRSKARELIATQNHEGLEIVVNQLFIRQETEEYKQARALFDFFVSYFPNCLTLNLLKLYQSSSNGVTRFRTIYQLSKTLQEFRTRSFILSLHCLHDIKPLVISCLLMQETKESDIKILRRIVGFVAYDVMVLYNNKWDELGDCIFLLADQENLKAFHVFLDLPPVYVEFIKKFLKIMLEKTKEVLMNPEENGVEDWSLALQTVVKLGLQFFNTGMKHDVIQKLMKIQLLNILQSAKKLVDKEKEQFLVLGLEYFERFLLRDMNLYDYTKRQCNFVSMFIREIGEVREVGTQTKEMVRKIIMLVTKPDNPSLIQREETQDDHGAEFVRDWYDHLKNLSALKVLKIFAFTDLEDRSREIAIRRLNFLLSDHTSKKVLIDVAEMRELQPLLISCLKEEGISDSIFKILLEVVNHVAYEIFVCQQDTWYDLRDYVASKSKAEFQRAVYIFQCLTVARLDDDFLNPVMENLLPEISTRINPPRELLVDNSFWVLAYTGAFCVIIHLIKMPNHAEYVEEIAHKMIDSVRKLVERGMEVGLVRRAFRDVETIVKKQVEWYSTSEYKFLKGLLWKLYAIKGMKWESKTVLWRINVIVEREVEEMEKELPHDDFDWLNLTDEVAIEN